MANKKISQLPPATAATGSELIAVVQASETRKMTLLSALMYLPGRCVWLRNVYTTSMGGVISNGGLTYTSSIEGIGNMMVASLAHSDGKHYFEVTIDVVAGAGTPTVGVAQVNSISAQVGQGPNVSTNRNTDWGLLAGGDKYGQGVVSAYGSALTAGDVLMVAVDLTGDKIWWGKNGTWFASGNPAAGTGAAFSNVQDTVYPAVTCSSGSKVTANFSGPFAHTIPTGFLSWESD